VQRKKTAHLPDTYTNVPPVAILRQYPSVPIIAGPNKSDVQLVPEAMAKEHRWLEHMKNVLVSDTLQENETEDAAFVRDVKALTASIESMGNQFFETSSVDLLVLDTRDIADPVVTDTVNQIEKLGQDQYDTFVSERL
ncbi:hypothetical protein ScPMuIL_010352, partial [Solemya velum]